MSEDTATVIPVALSAFAIFASWAIAGSVWSSRTKALARAFPDDEVLSAGRSRAIALASAAYVRRGEWIEGPSTFPSFFTIVISQTGVGFWKTRNSRMVSVGWDELGPVTQVLIPNSPRKTRGINFQIRSDGATIDLPVMVVGRGPFGLFVQSKRAIEAVCTRAESWRLASSRRV